MTHSNQPIGSTTNFVVGRKNREKKKAKAQAFADIIKDNPDKIIAWAKTEIKEYKKLIKILGGDTI